MHTPPTKANPLKLLVSRSVRPLGSGSDLMIPNVVQHVPAARQHHDVRDARHRADGAHHRVAQQRLPCVVGLLRQRGEERLLLREGDERPPAATVGSTLIGTYLLRNERGRPPRRRPGATVVGSPAGRLYE